MKNQQKNYYYSNFKNSLSPERTSKNDLEINHIEELEVRGGKIIPKSNFDNLFENLFDKNFVSFESANSALIGNIEHFLIYDYFDSVLLCEKSRYFAFDRTFELYELDFETYKFVSCEKKFTKLPNIVYDNGNLYFLSTDCGCIMVSGDSPIIVLTEVPKLINYCSYNNFSFFTIFGYNYNVFYSEKTNIQNLECEVDAYKSIEVNSAGGKILKIFQNDNLIFVIQQYAITTISASTSVKINSYISLNFKVLENTIAKVDDKIVLFSTAGLAVCDENSASIKFENETGNFSDIKKGISYNGKYYLLTDKFVDGIRNRFIAEFDLGEMSCSFYLADKTENIFSVSSYDYYIFVSTVFDENCRLMFLNKDRISQKNKRIIFNKISFDDSSNKTVNEIKIFAIGHFDIRISSENDEFCRKCCNNFILKNIGISGNNFDMEISGSSNFEISSIFFKVSFGED